MLHMKIFLLNFNDFTINENVLSSVGRSTKRMRAENLVWLSPRGDFKLKTTLPRGLKVNGYQQSF